MKLSLFTNSHLLDISTDLLVRFRIRLVEKSQHINVSCQLFSAPPCKLNRENISYKVDIKKSTGQTTCYITCEGGIQCSISIPF